MADRSRDNENAGPWIAGVDGCRGGWLVVLRPLGNPTAARAVLVPTFAEVLALDPQPEVIGIDMPIGLPEVAVRGGRIADIEARANLGARQSSVFAVPSRSAVLEADYREACAVALTTSDPPRKISKQCFNLFPKIREIDAVITPHLQRRVYEIHPELAFWALNGERPLDLPKKMKSQAHGPGIAMRRDLLASAGYDRGFLERKAFASSVVGPDDLLDAAACSWSAARIARGEGRRFPADPPLDAKGIRMEIWS